MPYTNHANIPLSVAVWLVAKEYNLEWQPYQFSVTDLIKSTRQIVLRHRMAWDAKTNGTPQEPVDLVSLVPAQMGTAVHSAIEKAWITNAKQALIELGTPRRVANAVRVNPEVEEPDTIPIYMEKRSFTTVGRYTVSGQFDFVIEGQLEDFKNTSVMTYQNQSKDREYRLQGSMYRWLNPKIITKDVFNINYLFTDFNARMANTEGYPKARIQAYPIQLMPIPETDAWVRNKLAEFEKYENTPEPQLPHCTKEELWQKDPVFKYYSNPSNTTGRSTKNFASALEAHAHLNKAGKGVVIESKGEVVACKYCSCYSVCTQKDLLIEQGLLR